MNIYNNVHLSLYINIFYCVIMIVVNHKVKFSVGKCREVNLSNK